MNAWAEVIKSLFDELFSRKLLASIAGIAGIVIMVVFLAKTLGGEVITETVLLAAFTGVVSITLYQVTKESQNGNGE